MEGKGTTLERQLLARPATADLRNTDPVGLDPIIYGQPSLAATYCGPVRRHGGYGFLTDALRWESNAE